MVVQHNLTAMNSNRMLGITQGAQAKSSEKLSSGYRINRAGDDAAGLSISEKMRKQIKGLDRAATNAQDGISAVQTAEGALTEVHSMLQRMNELAVQAANGTNSADDREAIQAEINQLTTEIDRVAETTKFNETYLLKGDVIQKNAKAVNFYESTYVIGATDVYVEGSSTTAGADDIADAIAQGKKIYMEAASTTDPDAQVTEAVKGTNYDYVNQLYQDVDGNRVALSADEVAAKVLAGEAFVTANGMTVAHDADAMDDLIRTENVNEDLKFTLHVGADSEATNKIGIEIAAMNAKGLGVNELDVTTEAGATKAIDTIAQAVSKVSAQRSALGAVQNRLEHTIANLDNVVENTTAAESRIRDTDMAEEMVEFSKNNILAQAGQSMLAQANAANQGVLSILG